MKSKNLLNIAAFALVVTGVIFKANHWPGANVSIILSGVFMLLALFTGSLKNKEEAESNKGLNYFLAGLLAFFIIGIEFKLMHWPGAGVFVVIAYILSFSLPIILMAQKSDFKVPRQFMITFFTYFILLIALFPKNPLTQFFKGGAIMNSESPAPENQSPLAN